MMFKNLLKKFDGDYDDDGYEETIDPVLEKRKQEKFSSTINLEDIEDEDDDEIGQPILRTEPVAEKKAPKDFFPAQEKPVAKPKKPIVSPEPTRPAYVMSEVISPMTGIKKDPNAKPSKPKVKKPIRKKSSADSLVPVISPFYGNFDEKEVADVESESLIEAAPKETLDLTETKETKIKKIKNTRMGRKKQETKPKEKVKKDVPTVEDNLRNIAKIVEEEQDELKIIEERTGEFKLDFSEVNQKAEKTLIDEIDDDMSLDELMSLYEKKFKD